MGTSQALRGDYDLITPILVCLGKKKYTELQGLLKLLNMVLLDDISAEEKLQTMQDEFEIEVTPHLEKGGSEMCNLSEGIEKRGDTKRMLIVVKNMIKKGKYAPEEIAEISGMPIEKVLELMNGKTA